VTRLPPGRHLDLLLEALGVEAAAQRALLAGDAEAAAEGFRRAADLYRRSWRVAPPRSYGRLVGMLKAAVIAGAGEDEAIYALNALGRDCDSPASCYALAIAALLREDAALAAQGVAGMRSGDAAFRRAADALAALAAGDPAAYAAALRAIVADFEARREHLTGVAIADTAVMLEVLAEARGMAARPDSALLPPRPLAAA
jgi:hypothetical protein